MPRTSLAALLLSTPLLLLAAGVALQRAGAAPAAGAPAVLEVWLDSTQVAVHGAGAVDLQVSVRTPRGATLVRTVAGASDGPVLAALVDDHGRPMPLDPGATITVTDAASGAPIASLAVPTLTIALDAATGVVTGHAPPAASLTLTVDHPFTGGRQRHRLAADGAGAYRVATGSEALLPGVVGQITLALDGGHTVHRRWRLPYLALHLDPPLVEGALAGAPPGVCLALADPTTGDLVEGPAWTGHDSAGGFSHALAHAPRPGDVLRIAPAAAAAACTVDLLEGEAARAVPAPRLEVSADPVADTLSGSTPAGRTWAALQDPVAHYVVARPLTGDGGAFAISLPPPRDLRAGDRGWLAHLDVERGAWTIAPWAAGPGLELCLGCDTLRGVAAPGAAVEVEHAGARATAVADALGRFDTTLASDDGSTAPVQPGQRLTLRADQQVLRVASVPFLEATADPASGWVQGSTRPGLEVTAAALPLLAHAPTGAPAAWATAIADAQGRFALRLPAGALRTAAGVTVGVFDPAGLWTTRHLALSGAPQPPGGGAPAVVEGTVLLPGRVDHTGVALTLAGPNGTLAAATGASGWFTFTGLPPGRYTLRAWHQGHLEAHATVDLAPGEWTVLPGVLLPAGDVTGDGRVGMDDLAQVWDAAGAADASADLTGDGRVDMRDAGLVMAYLGRTGPVPWPPIHPSG